jgi:SAM-dependent methyltransferase
LPGKTGIGHDEELIAQYAQSLQQRYALPGLDHWTGTHDDLQAIVAALPAAGLLGGPCLAHPLGQEGRSVAGNGDTPSHWVEGLIWDSTLPDVELARNVTVPTRLPPQIMPEGVVGTNPLIIDERDDNGDQRLSRGCELFQYLVEQANDENPVGIGYAQFACHVHDVEDFGEIANRKYARADTTHVLNLAHQVTEVSGGLQEIERNGVMIRVGMDAFIWRLRRPHDRPQEAFVGAGYTRDEWQTIFPDGERRLNSDAQPLAPNGLQNDGADHVPPLDEVEDIQDHHNMSAFAQAMFDQLQQPDGDTTFRLRIVDGPENQGRCRDFLSLRPEEKDLIRDCLGDRQEPRVLDIGCGIGRHSIFSRAVSPHARISIVEIDQSLRDYCIAEVPGAVCYEQFAHVPADASFDAVFLMGNGLGVFGNEANTCEQLQRLHSLVADGGCVLIECGNPFRGDFYAPQHVIEYNDSVDGPFTWGYATCEWLQRELVRVGFEIVTVKPSILGGPFFICHAKKCAIP